MNRLSREKRAQILGMMVEGVSIRAISRMTGASKNTIVKLLADAGRAFSDYQNDKLRNLSCERLQLDEIWSFVYAKAKNVPCGSCKYLSSSMQIAARISPSVDPIYDFGAHFLSRLKIN